MNARQAHNVCIFCQSAARSKPWPYWLSSTSQRAPASTRVIDTLRYDSNRGSKVKYQDSKPRESRSQRDTSTRIRPRSYDSRPEHSQDPASQPSSRNAFTSTRLHSGSEQQSQYSETPPNQPINDFAARWARKEAPYRPPRDHSSHFINRRPNNLRFPSSRDERRNDVVPDYPARAQRLQDEREWSTPFTKRKEADGSTITSRRTQTDRTTGRRAQADQTPDQFTIDVVGDSTVVEDSSGSFSDRRYRGAEGSSSWMDNKKKGREKDRNRRREQFVEKYEEQSQDELNRQEKERQKVESRRAKQALKNQAPTPIKLPDFISIGQLAQALRVHANEFHTKLDELGFETWNQDMVIGAETAGLIAMEYNFEPVSASKAGEEVLDLKARPVSEDQQSLPQRPPIVTIMGHVDHGKTTLLDFIRKSSVVETEHGGITQHIGAFSVNLPSGKSVTFLDTPGHAAFLTMRQRGANVTDIVVLVVAADDSVKPQTLEAIKHASTAGVPIVVAINKVDKPGADPQKAKQDLLANGVELEDFGGDTQAVLVSGKTGEGITELEDAILALSEMLDKRAEVAGPSEGWVIEATTKAEGRVATVLVRRGTLKIGDIIVAGNTWARARRLRNQAGFDVEEVTPGMPVEVHGWKEQPAAGDEVLSADDEAHAKRVVDRRIDRAERLKLMVDVDAINESRQVAKQADVEKKQQEKQAKANLKRGEKFIRTRETYRDVSTEDDIKNLNLIVKGDVSGSVEAVVDSISPIGNDLAKARVIRSGVGPISEFDIEHAAAAGGHVISFNMDIDQQMRSFAEYANVRIFDHNVIYRLVDDVRDSVTKLLPPLITKRVVGEADILQVFAINTQGRKFKSVAGCRISNGIIKKADKVRVFRGGVADDAVFEGSIDTLKNVKKDVEEMRKGTECGLGFAGWEGMKAGDRLQTYEEVSEARNL